MGFLIAIIVGGFAGYLASLVANRNSSLGILGNIVVGFLGGLISSLVFNQTSALSHPTWTSFGYTVLGAIILLVIVNFFTRKKLR